MILMAGGAARGWEEPSVDLFAGWWVSPFRYGAYPYGVFPWRCPDPVVGLGVPLYFRDGRAHDPYFADWGCYPYGWGYGQRVRLRLVEPRYAPALSDELSLPLPGSAPTELRDPERERAWEREFLRILGDRDEAAWRPDATNGCARSP
jgi:hypothetical protein